MKACTCDWIIVDDNCRKSTTTRRTLLDNGLVSLMQGITVLRAPVNSYSAKDALSISRYATRL